MYLQKYVYIYICIFDVWFYVITITSIKITSPCACPRISGYMICASIYAWYQYIYVYTSSQTRCCKVSVTHQDMPMLKMQSRMETKMMMTMNKKNVKIKLRMAHMTLSSRKMKTQFLLIWMVGIGHFPNRSLMEKNLFHIMISPKKLATLLPQVFIESELLKNVKNT